MWARHANWLRGWQVFVALLLVFGVTAILTLALAPPSRSFKGAAPSSPKFTVGDCFQLQEDLLESWEKSGRAVGKIAQVGKQSYLAYRTGSLYATAEGRTLAIPALDAIAEKTGCPR